MRPSVKKLLLFGSTAPYSGALLALDFVGSRTNGQPYYMLNGATYPRVNNIPGWTYTGGTPAGTGSYAARADGSLQFFPSYTNLLLQSQTFGTTWATTNSVLTENQIAAPDGTTTADKLNDTVDGGNAEHFVSQSVTPISGNVYSYSVYAKAGSGGRLIALRAAPSSWATAQVAYFDVSSGAVLGVTGGGSATITSVGSGWYRCNFTTVATSSSTSNTFRVQLANGTTLDYQGAGTSFNYIWGAQLELGSTASTYIPTTTAAVTVGTPRITDAGYWAEEARTNSIRNNSMVGAVAGTPGTAPTNWAVSQNANGLSIQLVGTGTDSVTSAPYVEYRFFGTTTGSQGITIKFDTGTGIAATNGQTWSNSVYSALVAGSVTGFAGSPALRFSMNTSGGSYIAESTGAALASTATMTRTAETFTTNQASTAFVQPYIIVTTGTGKSVDFTLRVSLPQMELGSFATPPIPTTSVAVTRAADVGYVSGLVVPSASTLLASATVQGPSGIRTAASLTSGATANRTPLFVRGDNVIMLQVDDATVNQYYGDASTATASQTYSAAARLVTGDIRMAAKGALSATASAGTVPTASLNRLVVGADGTGSGSPAQGPIRRIVIYPRTFANSELQAITTAGAY